VVDVQCILVQIHYWGTEFFCYLITDTTHHCITTSNFSLTSLAIETALVQHVMVGSKKHGLCHPQYDQTRNISSVNM